MIDSMSGFGAYDVNVNWGIDYLVSSSNKNIEGVPGIAFCIAKKDVFEVEGKNARSVSLDMLEQWQNLENTGQFRFTPPTHALVAFDTALNNFIKQGGLEKRAER